jgi:hypothetical protein
MMNSRLRHRFSMICVAVAVGLFLPLAGAAQESTPGPATPNPEPVGSQSNPQNGGKAVERGCTRLKVFTADTVEQTGGFMGAYSDEFKYLATDIEVRNQCDDQTIHFNPYQFTARDTGNGELFADVGPTFDYGSDMTFLDLEPQRKIRGLVAIKIDRDTRRVVVAYDTDRTGKNLIYFEFNVRLPGQE